MKKIALVTLLAVVISSGVAIAATYESDAIQANPRVVYGKTSSDVITAIQTDSDGKVVVSGVGGAFTETTDGAYLDGDVTITGLFECTTVNTGQGANELYDMDQNVLKASAVTFSEATIDGDMTVGGTWIVESGSVRAAAIEDAYLKNDGDTASGDYAFDTDTLKIDSVNGRIGIGDASPENTLDVVGDAQFTGDTTVGGTFYLDGDTAGSIELSVNNDIAVINGLDILVFADTDPTELAKSNHFYIDDDQYPNGVEITGFAVSRNLTQSDDLSVNAYIGTYGKAGFTADSTIETNTFTENLFVIEDNGTIDNTTATAGKYIVVDSGLAATGRYSYQVRFYAKG